MKAREQRAAACLKDTFAGERGQTAYCRNELVRDPHIGKAEPPYLGIADQHGAIVGR